MRIGWRGQRVVLDCKGRLCDPPKHSAGPAPVRFVPQLQLRALLEVPHRRYAMVTPILMKLGHMLFEGRFSEARRLGDSL